MSVVVAKLDDGTIFDVNPAFERLYGWPREEIIGRTSVELGMFADPEERGRVRAAVERTGRADTRGVRVRRKDGTERLVDGHSVAISMNGEPSLVSLIVDVSEAAQARASVRAREGELRAAFDAAPVGIVYADRRGEVASFNRRFAEIVGHDEPTLSASQLADLTHPDDLDLDVGILQRFARGESLDERFRKRFTRADGEVRTADVHVRVVPGDPEHLVIAVDDVTEKVRAEATVVERERQVRAAFERAPIGIAFSAPGEARWLEVNHALCAMLGHSREELCAASTLDLTHPDDRVEDAAIAAALGRGELTEVRRQKRFLRKDGSAVECEVHLVVLPGREGEPIRSVSTFTDLSAQRRAEDAVREAAMRWAATLEVLPLGFSIVRVSDMRLVDVNPAFERITGRRRVDLLGKTPDEIGLAADPGTRKHLLETLRRDGRATARGVVFRAGAGELRVADVSLATTTLGGDACLITTIEDVTLAHRSEEALRSREDRLRLAFDAAPIGIVFGPARSGLLVDVNERLCEMLGYARDELAQKTLDDLTHPEDRGGGVEELERLARGERRDVVMGRRLVRKSGETLDAELRVVAAPYLSSDGDAVTITAITDVTDRRSALASAHDAQSRWAATVRAAPLGIAVVRASGELLDVNPAFERILGRPRAELVGKTGAELAIFPAETRAALREQLAKDGVASMPDLRIRNASLGDRVVSLTSAACVVAGDPCFVSLLEDQTERVLAEDAAREAETRWAAIVRTSPFAIAITSAERGTVLDVNVAFERLTGYARADLLGRREIDLGLVLDVDKQRGLLAEATRHGSGSEAHLRYRARNGEVRVVELTVSKASFRSEPCFVAVMRDVTEERRTEEALRAREDAVLAAFENAPMALAFALPGEGRFSAVNARLCKLLGYTRQELLEKTVLETTHPDDRERSAEVMQRLAGGGAREVALGKRLLRKDGSAVECEVQIVRLPQDPSEMPRTVVGFVDLTAQRGVEEQLRAAQRMEAVGRLAGGVAHDFNNLLTVILSNLDLARSELPESSPAQETLEEIAQAGRRAEGLTRQLLAFSRKQHMVLERVSLGDLVRGLASMLRRLIGEDVALELDVSDELPAVNADRGQLEQVLMNLVINARDALPEGGAIHVGVRSCHVDAALATKRQVSTGDYLELWVADDGIGMDEATRVRVFEPFFTTKDKGKGTGLGLSTVYGIVKQHGGGIDVESEPGAGTTFRIYLPKAASSAKEPTSTKVAPASTKSGHDETLLVVEDDTATRRVLRRVLEGSGYRVVVCATPAEALDQAAALGGAIDLVLTDVVMPGMNGCDLVRRMRDQQPSLRVVYMSGYTDDALAGLELPKGHFIRKPFALDDLRRVIRQMLDEPEGTRDSQAVS